MLIDIKAISQGRADFIDIETDISSDDLSVTYQGSKLAGPPVFKGRLAASGNAVVSLTGQLQATITGECARCLKPVRRSLIVTVDDVYRSGAAGTEAEADDSYRYKGFVLDLLPAMRDNLVLALPPRLYCRENCRGICPDCGADLNDATCGCEAERAQANAPFSKLKELL